MPPFPQWQRFDLDLSMIRPAVPAPAVDLRRKPACGERGMRDESQERFDDEEVIA
jgi:hypothetical protein